jgi:membrane associated rhomboid family serine protease
MFIPLKDLNPSRRYPFVNYTLILVNLTVFLYEINLRLTLTARTYDAFIFTYSVVPARFSSFVSGHTSFEAAFLPLLTSMFLHADFLHGGWLHVAGNMLFLWIFGDNVEDRFGHLSYLIFYFVCGVGAGLLQSLFDLHSTVPALGASGAISGVMGAYILLYPRARVLTLVFIFVLPIPAVVVLGAWFLMQFLSGMTALGAGVMGGVAWWAHIGGFLLGMLLTSFLDRR